MAGYTSTPLPKKLGIKSGHSVVLLGAPSSVGRALARTIELDDGVRVSHQLRVAPLDVVVFFVHRLEDLEKRFADIASRLHPAGGFWIAWRKKKSRVVTKPTDITDEVVRRIGMAAGMVDNKVCAIDDTWSALRLVIRLENRDAVAYRAEPRIARTKRATLPPKVVSAGGSTQRRARARASR